MYNISTPPTKSTTITENTHYAINMLHFSCIHTLQCDI